MTPRGAPPGWGPPTQVNPGIIFGYLAVLMVFLTQGMDTYSVSNRMLAWFLFVLGTYPAIRFIKRPRGFPMLELVALQYALFFALPVFYESVLKIYAGDIIPTPAAIDMALVCAIMALVAITMGYRFSERLLRASRPPLDFETSDRHLVIYAVVTILGGTIVSSGIVPIPGSLAQPVLVIFSLDLGIALLACLFHHNRLLPWERAVTLSLVWTTVLTGLAGGMMQATLQPLLIWVVCRWLIRGRIPMMYGFLIMFTFLALQPVKLAYRQAVWHQAEEVGFVDRVSTFYALTVDRFTSEASSTSTSSDGYLTEMREAAEQRLSLLLVTAHYISWTPERVDYKNGETLMYMAYTWIPRAVWPGKPTAQSANKVMPLEYKVQHPSTINTAMFGVGHIAETYVNFGIVGIFPVFVVLGVLYFLPLHLLGWAKRRPAPLAILVALVVNMMYIGTTVGHIFGGFLQQILVQALLLRALTGVRTASRPRPGSPRPLPVAR